MAMRVLISSFLLLLLLMLMTVASSSPNPDWFLRAPKGKLMTVPGRPKKQCPCDHLKGHVKKTRHRRHKQTNKHSRACQQFLKRCQLASFALPL
ncbi:VEGF co-regulated chemokine 1 [Tupaia chinensis]|uniref:VEGF co-regulated chemokine 1 n=1 Tax=Tupaia chinensis TaxID=246437 RepID=L9L8U0_TUPCH|nr:VEGF co-regulated chemokine 1 [Tupaia chinensis]